MSLEMVLGFLTCAAPVSVITVSETVDTSPSVLDGEADIVLITMYTGEDNGRREEQ